MARFDSWMPMRVGWDNSSPQIEWLLLGDRRFTHPFFEDTIQEALRHPFHHAFRRSTDLDALHSWYEESPGLAPKGFIFHLSRCGSTLLCQVLATLERNIVLSEPPPVDALLRGHIRNPALDPRQRSEQIRWMLSAMGQKRHSTEEGVYVKFDCWSIPELPVVSRAFPSVPWIFLYRDPLEVLVSQLQIRALWSLPGGLPPEILGVHAADMPLDEYCARMLGRICEIALDQFRRTPGGLLVNYAEMPAFCTSGMLRHFQMEVGAEEVERMRQASVANSKNPTLPFEPDGDVKRHAATERMRELADRWIAPFYEELEIARRRQ